LAEVALYTFDVYQAGAIYGEASFDVTPELVRLWCRTFGGGDGGAHAPAGLIVLIQQKAYKDVVAPRPPGHIQGGQYFETLAPILAGARVTTRVGCVDKELRKGRRWVRMGFDGRTSEGPVYRGINTILVPM
jgi:hypothetical protein